MMSMTTTTSCRHLSAAELKRDATSRWVLSLAHATQPDRRSPPDTPPSTPVGRAVPGKGRSLSQPRMKARAPPRSTQVFLDRGAPSGNLTEVTSRANTQSGRLRVFCLIYAAYVGLLVARKNYGFWIPHAMATLDRSKSEVAVIGSSFEMASGAGALLNGFLIDAVDPSLALACALAASASINLGLARARSLPLMAALWGLNGAVQSLGWPCVSKVHCCCCCLLLLLLLLFVVSVVAVVCCYCWYCWYYSSYSSYSSCCCYCQRCSCAPSPTPKGAGCGTPS